MLYQSHKQHALGDVTCVNGVTTVMLTTIVPSAERLPVPIQVLVSFSALRFAVRSCSMPILLCSRQLIME